MSLILRRKAPPRPDIMTQIFNIRESSQAPLIYTDGLLASMTKPTNLFANTMSFNMAGYTYIIMKEQTIQPLACMHNR